MSDIAINVVNLSKRYMIGVKTSGTLRETLMNKWGVLTGKLKKDVDEFWALKNVSFEVKKGEVLGIIGKNGAGKSTLLKILSRISDPTSGRAEIFGRVSSLLEVGTGFHPELTGRENIFLNGTILGMSHKEVKQKFDEIVDFSGIEKFIDTPVKHFSSGMYVRLAFAVAAHLEPEILIIDEVLAVGDLEFQKKSIGKMDEVAKSGRTVLFVSHNLGAIMSLCTHACLLDFGEIKYFGSTNQALQIYKGVSFSDECLVHITDSFRVKGTKQCKVEICKIADKNGTLKNDFLINEDFQIIINFTSNIETIIGCWFIIYSGEIPVLCSHQKDIQQQKVIKGNWEAILKTKNISLLPGKYSISLGIMGENYQVFFDWIEHCLFFEIVKAFNNGLIYDERLGFYNINVDWNLSKIN